MSEPYDSKPETLEHIYRVRSLLNECSDHLRARGWDHDRSKLESPEKDAFDVLTPRLKGLTYGSDEYRASLKELKPALDHHYAHNSHHPEHYPDGVAGMSLLDLVEMICDWKAATERHADGSMTKSLEHNKGRFGIDDQLASTIANTVREMGWD